MTTTIKRITLAILLTLGLGIGLSLAATSAVSAQDSVMSACEGVALAGGDCSEDAESRVSSIVAVALNLFSFIVGVAAVIMIFIGGFKYVIASGDSNSVNSAKNTILFAVIGLVIVALAQVIVVFVINRVETGGPPPMTT